MSDDELIIVFEGILVEVDILKSFLDSNGMTSSAGGVSPFKIIVPKSELKRDKSVIEEYIQ